MNTADARFGKFSLVQEMLQTPAIIGRFDFAQAADTARAIHRNGRLLLTGEGSSRIFPAKNMLFELLRLGAAVGRVHRRSAAGPRILPGRHVRVWGQQ